MTVIRKAALACVASAVLALPLNATAQGPANQDTFFTFSQSVELPGTTLPAGTYFFQLADSPSNRHIVKVMSEDRKELHATLLAIPFYTNDRPSDKPQVRFMESSTQGIAGAGTNAIKIWFYPGRTIGHEFIYPRSQAMRIASRTGDSVLTTKTEAEVSETVADTDLTRVDRGGADTTVDMSARSTDTIETPAAAAQTEPQTTAAETRPAEMPAPQAETAQAQTEQTPQAMPRRDDDTDRATTRTALPNTAGVLPLLAVIGIGSLIGSRLLRRSRRA